jgi:hypothetical protein
VTATPTTPRPFLASLLRSAGIGVAAVELVFLTIWMGLTLGLIESVQPYLRPLRPVLLDSLPALLAGMAVAAVIGGVAGLAIAAIRRAMARKARSRD